MNKVRFYAILGSIGVLGLLILLFYLCSAIEWLGPVFAGTVFLVLLYHIMYETVDTFFFGD